MALEGNPFQEVALGAPLFTEDNGKVIQVTLVRIYPKRIIVRRDYGNYVREMRVDGDIMGKYSKTEKEALIKMKDALEIRIGKRREDLAVMEYQLKVLIGKIAMDR